MSFTNKIVITYAKSLFQTLNSNKDSLKKIDFQVSQITSKNSNLTLPNLYIVGEELLLLSSTITSSKKIKEIFSNPTYREQQKLDILLNIFPGLSLTIKSFLKVLAERTHLSLLPEISGEYNELLFKFKNITKVKLLTASSLDENYGVLLLEKLKTLTSSSEIILKVAYNPKLLGGLILEYNSISIDASVLKEFSLFFTEI